MEVLLKILRIDHDSKSVVVNAFTEALLKKQQNKVWPEQAQKLLDHDVSKTLTREQALAKAQEMWPAGSVWSVTIYQDPMPEGQELIDYITKSAVGNGVWLEHMGKCSTKKPDMKNVESLLGKVHKSVVTTPSEEQENGPKATSSISIRKIELIVPETAVEGF